MATVSNGIFRLIAGLLGASLLIACGGDAGGDTVGGDTAVVDSNADSVAVDSSADTIGADTATADTLSADTAPPPAAVITLLHTSDEHGWIDGEIVSDGTALGGAARVLAAWKLQEPADSVIVSSGDSFVGAAISSWFDGAPTIEVMNAMGYDALALGNHELDLGLDVLSDRVAQADFPFLAANAALANGDPWPLVTPWHLVEVDGVMVGIVGLANASTGTLAPGQYTAQLSFAELVPTLDVVVPEVRDAGADIVVVLGHVGMAQGVAAAMATTALVDAWFGGHSHQIADGLIHEAPAAVSGSRFKGYTRLVLEVDRATGEVSDAAVAWVPVGANIWPDLEPEAELAALVAIHETARDEALGGVIGWLDSTVEAKSWTQANWVTDSWLWRFPEADVALQNSGGLRNAITAGPIERGAFFDAQPFDNIIFRVELSGGELATAIAGGIEFCGLNCFVAIAGARYGAVGTNVTVTDADGAPLDANTTYTVLLNSYMYFGGAGFGLDGVAPDFYDTGLNYRDPVIEWTEAQGSAEGSPLDKLLDASPRNSLD